MVASHYATASTAEIVVSILELLDRNTDREHGITAVWIADQLGVTEKTVRSHLHTLQAMQPFGRKIGRIERKDLEHAESADPRPGWYIEPIFDTAQMRLLTDGVVLSRSDSDYLQELIAKVYAFAGQSNQLGAFGKISTPRNYNREFLNNIELLNDAIVHERTITFRYCTYDVDGTLVSRKDADGNVKSYAADPYRLMYRNGKYYLICHMHQHDNLSYLHVERFRDLSVNESDHSLMRKLDSFNPEQGAPFDWDKHMGKRPYPMDGKAIPIHLRIKNTLEPIYDWFDTAQVTRLDACTYDVWITANEKATLWWALQYADDRIIEVLSPPSLRDTLRRDGEYLASLYADVERISTVIDAS
ncbi:WYL domain-containing transcriptional regulator [Bifidobacterium imperatoris]|uniref:DNA-binding protein n=1 Tax=Bifidobacterium imperatoris TaxID=2020965 RepID=A0A2N5IRR4_9BIFI|nr:WYL domain-containing transcriptional regulator [Bifidobacterium imperatoris]PLS24649.1 DNA-binding protein [Bifidobacterium imperatoris]QSY57441.1 WYL domain-containing transcriptional regulator [Bifidobacterium imperatoris]